MTRFGFLFVTILMFSLNVNGQSVDSENEIDFGAWLVDKDLDFQGSESAVGVCPTMKDVKWLLGKLPKGYVVFGADGIYENSGRGIKDEYIYSNEHDGFSICRFKKSDLSRRVVYTYSIPHEYGNGKVYKLENGKSFKIVPFKPNGKAKYGAPELRKFINGKNCYVLIVMTANGAVDEAYIMTKNTEGFTDACLEMYYNKEMKVSTQGVLLNSGTIGYNEWDLGPCIKWIVGENRLVLYSGGALDYNNNNGKATTVLDEACYNFYVAPAHKVLNPAVTDKGLYDVIGAVKEVKEGWHDAVKFSKTGRVLSSKKDVVRRDKNGRLIEWKIYEKMSEPQYPTYHEKVWKYDSNGNVIYYGERSDFADGYANHILYECDKEGRVVKQIVPMEEENPECVTECIREGTDTIAYRYLQFDKYGNWIKRSCINSGICEDYEIGKTTWHKFTYEETCERIYDEKGNWVKMAIKSRATDNNKDNYYNKEDDVINPKEGARSRTIKYYEDTYD